MPGRCAEEFQYEFQRWRKNNEFQANLSKLWFNPFFEADVRQRIRRGGKDFNRE
jgi:hypothetical protein